MRKIAGLEILKELNDFCSATAPSLHSTVDCRLACIAQVNFFS
jgi:hypothetical protein